MGMEFGMTLDLTNVEPAKEYEYTPLPEGTYKVICHEFDVVEKPWGKGAKVKFTVIEGEYQNRRCNDFFIILHTNTQAQDIGQRRIRAWCDALGIPPNLESAEPLLHKPVMAKIKIDPPRVVGDKEYKEQNRIETFFAADVTPAAAPVPPKVTRPAVAKVPAAKPAAAASAIPATANAAAPKAMPWKR